MTPADAPITNAQALADLRAILYAAQHARSVMAENGMADDRIGRLVMADLEPWLWAERQNIILPLAALIQRCEANGGVVAPIDYHNILWIAHRTPSVVLGVLLHARRELPSPQDGIRALMS